jgi:hypothetical protein
MCMAWEDRWQQFWLGVFLIFFFVWIVLQVSELIK